MLKPMDRYIPDHIHVDAVEPVRGNAYHITRDSNNTREFINAYTMACIVQHGAVEFKTLKEVKDEEE